MILDRMISNFAELSSFLEPVGTNISCLFVWRQNAVDCVFRTGSLSLSLAYVSIFFSDVCFLLFPLWLAILSVPILRKCDLIEPLDIPGWPPYLQSHRIYRVTLFINCRTGPWESLRGLPDRPIKVTVLYKMNDFYFLYIKYVINYINTSITSLQNFQKCVDIY